MDAHISDSVLKCPTSSHETHLNSIGHTKNQGRMKPPIQEMKNSHFTCLPLSGLENHEIMNPGHGSFLPGWSKTSRRTRTRPGKVGPDNEDQVTENLPLKKRKTESAFPPTSGISDLNPPFANEPAIIHGTGFSTSGKSLRTQIPGPSKNHVCDICDRAFKSYQALGGHKSHHNNKAHETRSTFRDRDTLTTAVYGERAEGRLCGPVHRCPFCDKVFSKGQALGGHKRHCRRARYDGPTGFSFDLNELPPEWVPEETGAHTSG